MAETATGTTCESMPQCTRPRSCLSVQSSECQMIGQFLYYMSIPALASSSTTCPYQHFLVERCNGKRALSDTQTIV
jgi:hypothetical protein